jgi:hypothetical protein
MNSSIRSLKAVQGTAATDLAGRAFSVRSGINAVGIEDVQGTYSMLPPEILVKELWSFAAKGF